MKKNIDQLLFSAFADATPDHIDSIVKQTENKNAGAIMSVTQENYRKKTLHYAAFAAAMLVLVAGIILTVAAIQSREVFATVTVEGVECVDITLGRNSRPISLIARDGSSTKVTRHARKDYHTLSEAVDFVLDAMREVGGLNDDSNTVLFTVDGEEDVAEDQLAEVITAAKDSFTEASFDGAILGTVASDNEDILNISRRNSVTVGKAGIVHNILCAIPTFNATGLCRLSVNELNLICHYRAVSYAAITAYGLPHGCITPEEAAELTLSRVDDPTATAKATLLYDDSGLYYSVTVKTQDGDLFYHLSAVTGEILSNGHRSEMQKPSETVSSATLPATQPTETSATVAIAPTEDRPVNTQPPTPTTAPSPTTSPKPTSAPKPTTSPKPTTAPKPTEADPDIFTRAMYYRYTAGIYGEEILPATARQITSRRVHNGYDTYYDASSFPYAAQGTQGGITALVFNTIQFRNLTGTDDDRFDDAYFRTHVLYVYMNCDADYHWTKSIAAAYIDGSVLYIEDAEPVGRYVGDQETKIHTVIYELNKADLKSFTNMLEFTEQKGE